MSAPRHELYTMLRRLEWSQGYLCLICKADTGPVGPHRDGCELAVLLDQEWTIQMVPIVTVIDDSDATG